MATATKSSANKPAKAANEDLISLWSMNVNTTIAAVSTPIAVAIFVNIPAFKRV